MKKIFLTASYLFIAILVGVTVAYAGSLTPPGPVANTMYSLTDIYNLSAGTITTLGSGTIPATPASIIATGKTLTEVYDALSTELAILSAGKIAKDISAFGLTGTLYGNTDASKVLTSATYAGTYNVSNLANNLIKQGTTWGVSLGSTGTLTPDGGTAGVGGLFNGLTAHLTGDWSLDTGTLNLACNTAIFDATGNLVADAYDGTGTGLNRWCITDSGDAVAGNILSGKIAWVDGLTITGTMPTQTLSAANDTVSAGYYAATTLATVDADLVAGNIKTGVNIFGVVGTGIISLGDAVAGNVLAGKYFSNATTANVLGTMADKTGLNVASTAQSQAVGVNYFTAVQGYYDGTAKVSATDAQVAALNANLLTGNIKSGITIFGVAGKTEVVDTTEATVPIAVGTVLSGKKGFVNGALVTGTMPTQTLSALNDTVSAGYYAATTLSAVDTDLTAGNIKTGITIFGVAGSASPLILPKTGQTIVYQTNDDGTYQKGFAGTRFTDNINGTITDNATNLMWIQSPTTSPGAPFNVTMTWADAITNCEALSYASQTDWRLPNVKELQSIADYGRFSPAIDPLFTNTQSGAYWSSTTYAVSALYAWYVYFSNGLVNNIDKTNSYYVRCVR